ncbi:prophage tail fiber N-terminal domain-containing protein [Lelliottia wanjuensis]|uniref:Prophage tail fiber N-terminal domain-containing protein n=1 Tax=Lelliottia wanjuensis TaxID=3050585 RepID=A0AAP4D364_9ENTR|nr:MULTISPECIES: prophage tail fiber N-terminal domain-containing protein [unclassified Lelliottia]MDK9364167.1 prophage tail fiber N-terminal domain-containing protein [Lelliottia sp. V106_12]MDK9585410.1 prophage tail fiber N-terminal domain-containing protein [Lelliottia sp. V86_10]MDK9617156.1 prophage tail fiber N-terminal domain-containing protein [Lelliottia sp. V106_9]
MRNRLNQPAPLDLPPVEVIPIRIYGQLIGPMQRPEAFVKILLKAITTNQLVVQDTWSECTADQGGNYDFSVNPGKYAVYFERSGIKTRVQNIQVYSDSAPGNLQSFMLSPAPELLTPLVVMEIKSALELASAAMLRARQWAENPVDVPVLDFEQGAGPEYSAYHWAHKAMEALDTDTNINWRGEWSSTAAYAFRDAVRWRPDANTAYSSYYCLEANTNHTPPTIDVGENEFWSLMAAGGTNGKDGIDGNDGSDSVVPGPPGPATTLSIGTVTAVPYGTIPTVTISGNPPNQVLNFKLETGPEGAAASANTASKAANGWWQCGSTGIIEQWIQGGTVTSDTTISVTFPKAFPTACSMVLVGTLNAASDPDAEAMFQLVSKTATGCVVISNRAYGDTGSVAPLIYAVGY